MSCLQVNVYVPNSGDGLKRLDYRVGSWDKGEPPLQAPHRQRHSAWVWEGMRSGWRASMRSSTPVQPSAAAAASQLTRAAPRSPCPSSLPMTPPPIPLAISPFTRSPPPCAPPGRLCGVPAAPGREEGRCADRGPQLRPPGGHAPGRAGAWGSDGHCPPPLLQALASALPRVHFVGGCVRGSMCEAFANPGMRCSGVEGAREGSGHCPL